MKKKKVCACLLAGGKGTRLWPLSREDYSKSFVSIGDRKPLISDSIKRLKGLVDTKNIFIVVDKTQEKLLRRFTMQIPKRNILVEPFGRSTASAIGLAAIKLNPEDIMLVLPTDSLIEKSASFTRCMKSAISFTRERENALLCFGVKPSKASTAYGYIKVKSHLGGPVWSVEGFFEKPSEKAAKRLVKNKKHLWNAGIFIFKAKSILGAMKKHTPRLYRELSCIKKDGKKIRAAYRRMKNVSVDYQIMEKAKNLYCVRSDFSWSDIGSWNSMDGLLKKDRCGNICFGKVRSEDTYNSILYNSSNTKLGAIGLKDMVIVSTQNGTLACSKKDAEKVKKLVNTFKRYK